jgi:hypothetical protein
MSGANPAGPRMIPPHALFHDGGMIECELPDQQSLAKAASCARKLAFDHLEWR